MLQSSTGVHALRTAVPYIRAYRDRTFVVKLGGRLCDDPVILRNIADQVALLATLGIRVVVVHGGGERISRECERLGVTPRIVHGRRVTDEVTLEVVKSTLAGTVNTNLVAAFHACGGSAVGLTGVDGGMVTVERRPVQMLEGPDGSRLEVDFGFVGDILDVTPGLLTRLIEQGSTPVIASLAADRSGQIYNVNADTFAARIAVALGAIKYFLLTNVDGVLRDIDSPASLIPYLDLGELDELTRSGAVHGGMLPKLAACRAALRGGVPRAHIVNGAARDALLAEVFTNEGSGTLLVVRREGAATSNTDTPTPAGVRV